MNQKTWTEFQKLFIAKNTLQRNIFNNITIYIQCNFGSLQRPLSIIRNLPSTQSLMNQTTALLTLNCIAGRIVLQRSHRFSLFNYVPSSSPLTRNMRQQKARKESVVHKLLLSWQTLSTVWLNNKPAAARINYLITMHTALRYWQWMVWIENVPKTERQGKAELGGHYKWRQFF